MQGRVARLLILICAGIFVLAITRTRCHNHAEMSVTNIPRDETDPSDPDGLLNASDGDQDAEPGPASGTGHILSESESSDGELRPMDTSEDHRVSDSVQGGSGTSRGLPDTAVAVEPLGPPAAAPLLGSWDAATEEQLMLQQIPILPSIVTQNSVIQSASIPQIIPPGFVKAPMMVPDPAKNSNIL